MVTYTEEGFRPTVAFTATTEPWPSAGYEGDAFGERKWGFWQELPSTFVLEWFIFAIEM